MSVGGRWNMHWLEASGDLTPWRLRIEEEVDVALEAVGNLLPLPSLDILVQRLKGFVIPETGMGGHAYRGNLFSITIDPDNENFEESLSSEGLRQLVVHEVHHCMRMAGPGYGDTLGEALVSEGLAGRFVQYLLGSLPAPWETAVSLEALKKNPPAMKTLASCHYDHEAWFFGTGVHPRWLGYTLGYQIADCWLAREGNVSSSDWVNVAAHTVLDAGLEAGLIVDTSRGLLN